MHALTLLRLAIALARNNMTPHGPARMAFHSLRQSNPRASEANSKADWFKNAVTRHLKMALSCQLIVFGFWAIFDNTS
jgi:hypothetical protein